MLIDFIDSTTDSDSLITVLIGDITMDITIHSITDIVGIHFITIHSITVGVTHIMIITTGDILTTVITITMADTMVDTTLGTHTIIDIT